MDDLPEIWMDVPGVPYRASSCGRVIGPRGAVLKTSLRSGYRYVSVLGHAARRQRSVHQLVCEAFHGACPDGQEARHLDGDSLNNCASNLAWGTHSANLLDAVEHGTHGMTGRTHCPKNHEYTPENTYRRPSRPNVRECRTCRRDWKKAWT